MVEEEREVKTESGHDHLQGSHQPKVSILLPNRNTRPFLEERIQSILDQTFTDWELIIVDSYSDDGAWEYFQECAQKDARMRISQAPREGIYAGWNRCIQLARGEYVYTATSDDTMTSDCLEKMVAALELHPDCGMAVCCLRTIDADGNEINGTWDNYPGNLALGERLKVMHVRYPPYDTIINCAWGTTWISITQLLIRRTVLDRIGFFRTDCGSWGDFEWNVRSSLLTPRVHVPEFLATWRKRPGQATRSSVYSTAMWHREVVKMIRQAYETAKNIDPQSVKAIPLSDLLLPHTQEIVKVTILNSAGFKQRIFKLIVLFFEYSYATYSFVVDYVIRRDSAFGIGPKQVQKILRRAKLME